MKRIIALVCVLTLTIGMASTVEASGWRTWINGTYESAFGSIKTSKHGFTAILKSIGWMGCWGGQAHYMKKTIKGKKYRLKFNIKSTKMKKYVWVKIGNEKGSKISFAKWIDCKKGKIISINKTFKAKGTFKMVSFGFGGDYGDRASVRTDSDAKARYKYAPSRKLDGRLGPDSAADHPTVIKVTGLSLTKISGKAKLSKKLLIMDKGETKILKLKNAKSKVKWITTNNGIIKVTKKGKNKIRIKAKKTGLTSVIAKSKGKKYKCRIAVF